MTDKRKKWSIFSGLLLVLIFSAPFIRLFFPAWWGYLGNSLWPDKIYPIKVWSKGKFFTARLYLKRAGHLNHSNQTVPSLFLCDIPCGTREKEHIKIFPNGLGVFQTPKENFLIFPQYLFIREGSLLTIPLEDDIKGWGRTYSITKRGGIYDFQIFSDSENNSAEIKFSIPAKILEKIPDFENAGAYQIREKNLLINYSYKQWCRKKNVTEM